MRVVARASTGEQMQAIDGKTSERICEGAHPWRDEEAHGGSPPCTHSSIASPPCLDALAAMAAAARDEWEVLLSSLSCGGAADRVARAAPAAARAPLVSLVRAGRYLPALASPRAAALLADDALPAAAEAGAGPVDEAVAVGMYARLRSRVAAFLDAAPTDGAIASLSPPLKLGSCEPCGGTWRRLRTSANATRSCGGDATDNVC
jgi:hypothetical protein